MKYVPISPRVLRPDSKGQFDLYLRRDGNYVLFNASSLTITRDKLQDLLANNVPNLFIEEEALEYYKRYVMENIASILDDDSISTEERAQAWAGTATQLGRELFEKALPGPTLESRYKRFAKLIEQTTSFLQSPKSLKQLSRFISKGYEDYQHGIATMVYTVALMQDYDFGETKIMACGMGALLHDIGKAGLPEEIVNKHPDTLTDKDKEIMALHPMIGARTCSTFNLPTAASNCILFHHEREDGSGYPTNAKGSDLPIHTKIVSLCDRYDNLTRNKPYRKAYSPFEALKIIMEDPGFVDKAVFKKFVQLLSKAQIT